MEWKELLPLLAFIFCIIICPFLINFTEKSKAFSYVFWLAMILIGINGAVYVYHSSQIGAYEDALSGKKPLYAATQEEHDAFDAKYDKKEHELELKKEQHVLDLMSGGMTKEDAEEKADDDFLDEEASLAGERLDKESKLGHTPARKKLLAMLSKEKTSRTHDMLIWSFIGAAVYTAGFFEYAYRRK